MVYCAKCAHPLVCKECNEPIGVLPLEVDDPVDIVEHLTRYFAALE